MGKKGKGLGGSASPAVDTSLDTSRDKGRLIAETLRFLSKAKTLIEKAKENDGQVNIREIQAIVAGLLPDLNALAGGDVKGRVSKVREGYKTLLDLLEEVPAVRDALKGQYPTFFTFFDDLVIGTAEAQAEAELPELVLLEPLDESEQPSEVLKNIAGKCDRISAEADLLRRYMPDVRSRAEAINSGPFKVRASFVTDVNEAVKIVDAKVKELEALRDRSATLLVEVRTADANRRDAILQEIESMPLVDLVRIAGASITRVRTGVAQERQNVRDEIEELFAQLPSEKQKDGEKIVRRIASLVKQSKDAQLMNCLEQMKVLAQLPGSIGGDRATVDNPVQGSVSSDFAPVHDIATSPAAEAAPLPETASLPERPEIAFHDRQKLLDFFDSVRQYKAFLEDPNVPGSSSQQIKNEVLKTLNAEVLEIAHILARVQRENNLASLSDEISFNEVVLAFQFFIRQNISPQEYIDSLSPDFTLWDKVRKDYNGNLLYPDIEPRPITPVQRSWRKGKELLASPVRELGPLPIAIRSVDGRGVSSEVEKETVLTRMRGWTKQKFSELEDSDVYRVHLKGEKTSAEIDGSAPTLSRPAMITGAILSAALSYSGGALFADLPRYIGQRYYTRAERDEILTAFRAALEKRRGRDSGASESVDVQGRSDALRKRVFASRYLTEVQKQELLLKLKGEEDSFVGMTSPYDERLNREVGRILEHAIRTRISEEKLLKESVNTLFAVTGANFFAVTGANFLRAPAYGAISLYERWSQLTREAPESKAGDRLRATVAGGFDEYWDKFKGKKGRLAQAAAWGTAARFVGMGMTFVGSDLVKDVTGHLLQAWQQKEPLFPPEVSGLFEKSFAQIRERLGSLSGGLPEVPAPEPEVASSEPVYVPETISSPDDVLPESVPSNVLLAPEKIPPEALVKRGAGITQSLLAAVEALPELLRDAESAALRDDYTAALFMRRMAAKDGLLDYWINDRAVGELAIVPSYDAQGVAHIAFLNPNTGTAYSIDELKKLGWLTKAPK